MCHRISIFNGFIPPTFLLTHLDQVTSLSVNYNSQEGIAVTGSNSNNFKLLNLLIKFAENFAPSEYLQSTAKLLKL